ncbi:hypothetical protein BpHYR1_052491 [Brachionus plicatilis]|uniref:Uncharacterized protein n=1 Tax=Brachionus plicatilis TaxID=10195 RepID=A0A3M7R812_BRAPC|nr:hypothetical protein BpHYR1_052491 [Brachionus plicatilis]
MVNSWYRSSTCQSLSSKAPKHVLGGTNDLSVATIYRTCISRFRLKLWRFYILFLFFNKKKGLLRYVITGSHKRMIT